MIKVLDYGMGNISSILNMLHKSGANTQLCYDSSGLDSATAIILPGVGAFDNGIEKLKNTGLLRVLEQKVLIEKVPFLGICLGMQMLFDKSEEGNLPGFGWINGEVTRFDFSNIEGKSLKVPHMGWNLVNPISYDDLFYELEEEARFYFVHSYHVNCTNTDDILATTVYGHEFTCAVRHQNIWGAQFHPEKSHRFGVQFFKNFLKETNHA